MNREDIVDWVRHLIYQAYGFDYLHFDACEEDNAFEMMWLREDESTHFSRPAYRPGKSERRAVRAADRRASLQPKDRVPQTIAERAGYARSQRS